MANMDMWKYEGRIPIGNSLPAPGPHGIDLIKSYLGFRKDTLNKLSQDTCKYGDIIRYSFGSRMFHILAHPQHIDYVFHGNSDNYDKRTYTYRQMQLLLGNGPLTGHDEIWFEQRKAIRSWFHHQKLEALDGLIVEQSGKMISSWKEYASSGQPVELLNEMVNVTLGIISRAFFSSKVEPENELIAEAVTTVLYYINRRIEKPFTFPLVLPFPGNRKIRYALDHLNGFADKLFDEPASLRLPLAQLDEKFSRIIKRDIVMTLLIAGHETTANALNWTWYLLCLHPVIQEKAREELKHILGQEPPCTESMHSMPYLSNIINESLRLYPPVWMVERRAIKDDIIGGYSIPANSTVAISQYLAHRHPGFWSNPDQFNPDRFSAAGFDELPKFAYFPFGGGMRACIGWRLGLMELKIISAMILQNFRLKLVSDFPVQPVARITLRPKEKLMVMAEKV